MNFDPHSLHHFNRPHITRKQKKIFHWALILVVAGDFIFVGARLADSAFLILAVAVELE